MAERRISIFQQHGLDSWMPVFPLSENGNNQDSFPVPDYMFNYRVRVGGNRINGGVTQITVMDGNLGSLETIDPVITLDKDDTHQDVLEKVIQLIVQMEISRGLTRNIMVGSDYQFEAP